MIFKGCFIGNVGLKNVKIARGRIKGVSYGPGS